MNTFKKQIIASAVALGFVGAAQAATSVTLYGIVDVGYGQKSITSNQAAYERSLTTLATTLPVGGWYAPVTHGTTGGVMSITVPASVTQSFGVPASSTSNSKITQNDGYKDTSRIGVKGQEDLGNGLSAIFKAEMRFDATTGTLNAPTFAESYVGLKGSFGELTAGRRENITSEMFGYDSNAKELSSLVGANWDNSLSYRGQFGSFKIGADVTTGENIKGYAPVAPAPYQVIGGRAYQYAVGAEYNFGAGSLAAGYEHSAVGKNAYVAGAKYKFGHVELFGRYSQARQSVVNFDLGFGNPNLDKNTRERGFAVGLNYDITPNDIFGLSYSHLRTATQSSVYSTYNRLPGFSAYNVTNVTDTANMISADYTHKLSKRTSLYAGVTFDRVRTTANSQFYNFATHAPAGAIKVPTYTSQSSRQYNFGLVHKF